MAELAATSPLAGIARPGRHGRSAGPAGLMVEERTGLALASLIARKGKAVTLMAAIEAAFGVRPVDAPRRVAKDGVAFIGVGPGQWLASAEGEAANGFLVRLEAAAGGLAAVVDQSDSRLVLRLSGPRVRGVLAKGVPVDLDASVFGPASAASTIAAYVNVLLIQLDDAPTYDLMAPRSYAGSLWSWLMASAAEHGCEVRV
jgi:sarcosine oxidase subunit gamma